MAIYTHVIIDKWWMNGSMVVDKMISHASSRMGRWRIETQEALGSFSTMVTIKNFCSSKFAYNSLWKESSSKAKVATTHEVWRSIQETYMWPTFVNYIQGYTIIVCRPLKVYSISNDNYEATKCTICYCHLYQVQSLYALGSTSTSLWSSIPWPIFPQLISVPTSGRTTRI